jgi:hypothetical protein
MKFIKNCFALAALLISANVSASLILHTASGEIDPSGYGGVVVSNDAFVMHRFELTETTNIGSVGGFFNVRGSEVNLFSAFVSLTGQYDLPDSIDLSTSDVVATTTFNVAEGLQYTMTDFSLSLDAGWYALAFGAGKFGAGDVIDFQEPYVSMTELPDDHSSDNPISALQPTFWGTKNAFIFQGISASFVISSDTSAASLDLLTNQVPEPSVISLFAVFLALTLLRSRARSYFC